MNFSFLHLLSKTECPLSLTGSALARTYRSLFARCTLGLNLRIESPFPRHLYLNILFDHCLHDLGLYIRKIMTNKEMVNF